MEFIILTLFFLLGILFIVWLVVEDDKAAKEGIIYDYDNQLYIDLNDERRKKKMEERINKFKVGDKVKDKEGNLLTIIYWFWTKCSLTDFKYKVEENSNIYDEEELTLYEEPKAKLSNEEFLKKAKELVRGYTEEKHKTPSGAIPEFEVYIVWSCKTLQHSKALLSTTIPDTRYYEVTYNGIKNEIYFDAYNKEMNRLVEVK